MDYLENLGYPDPLELRVILDYRAPGETLDSQDSQELPVQWDLPDPEGIPVNRALQVREEIRVKPVLLAFKVLKASVVI